MSSRLSQFHQWLYTYLLYAQISLTPSVQVIRDAAGTPLARVPLLKQTRWRGAQLRVPDYALDKMPPRLLALIAVRNYIEATQGRRYAVRSVLLTVTLLLIISPLVYALSEKLFPKKVYQWLFHLAVLAPLEPLWSWREHFAEKMDRETIARVAETHTFIQALEAAIRLDLQRGVPESQARDLLVRLNILRREQGYPELAMDELKPPPSEEAQPDVQHPPAISKEEFLRRHPPEEYNKVDGIRV